MPKDVAVPLRLACALVAALLLVLAVPGQAAQARVVRSLEGVVVAAPDVRGARLLVPVLVDGADAREAGVVAPVLRVAVDAGQGVRALSGSITGAQLRLGDRVAAEDVELSRADRGALRPRVSAAVLRVRVRGPIASFGALEAAVVAARDASVLGIARLAGPPAPGAQPIRAELLALRTQLHLLDADLVRFAAAIGEAQGAVARGHAPPPGEAVRVAGERRALRDLLGAARTQVERADAAVVEAVAALDAALAGLGEAALTMPAPAGPAARAALERTLPALGGLAPPRIGRRPG